MCVFTLPVWLRWCVGARHHQELGAALASEGPLGAPRAAQQVLGPQRSCRWGLATAEGGEAGGRGGDAWFWRQEPSSCDSLRWGRWRGAG